MARDLVFALQDAEQTAQRTNVAQPEVDAGHAVLSQPKIKVLLMRYWEGKLTGTLQARNPSAAQPGRSQPTSA